MKLVNFFTNLKNRLFTTNQEPLTKLSKIFLIIFLGFSFYIISMSLRYQSFTVERPDSKFGYKCIEYTTSKAENIDVTTFKYRYLMHIHKYNDFGSDSMCQELGLLYDRANKKFVPLLQSIETLQRKKAQWQRQVNSYKQEYSNTLLEKIANQPKDKSILSSNANNIKSKIDKLNNLIDSYEKQINESISAIKRQKEYKDFIAFLTKNSTAINDKYSKYKKMYALKLLLSKYLFLVPLAIVVYLLYSYAIRRKKYIFSHLMINLLSLVTLFILFYFLEFVYNIIPHIFFEKLYALLIKLNIIAFANYIIIALIVIIFGLIIKFIQNRANKQKRLKQEVYKYEYIKNGKCHNCGAKREKEYKFCQNCGANLYETCPHCNGLKVAEAKFCQECGSQNDR